MEARQCVPNRQQITCNRLMVMMIRFKLITISPQEDWLSLAMYDKSIWDTTHGSEACSILDVLR